MATVVPTIVDHEIVITTQADWELGTLTNLDSETSPGDLLVAAGERRGDWLSPIYEVTDWESFSGLRWYGQVPPGCNIYGRLKSAATEGEMAAAPWSPYLGVWQDGVTCWLDTETVLLNMPEAVPGPCQQFQMWIKRA